MTDRRLSELAQRAAFGSVLRHRVGAIIVTCSGRIATGHNKLKTHPRSPSAWSIHAEVDAVLNIPRGALHGATICVVRVTKKGLLAMSRPCAGCMGILLECGIARIVFSGRDRQLHSENWHGRTIEQVCNA